MNPTYRTKCYLFVVLFFAAALGALGQTRSGVEADINKCWSYVHNSDSASVLGADAEQIYLGSAGGKVEAISLDAKKIWQSEFGGEINSNFLPVDEGLILATSAISDKTVSSGSSTLRSVSKETGITNWALKLPDSTSHHLALNGSAAIVVSDSDVVRSVDVMTGVIKWKRGVADRFVAQPSFSGTRVVVATAAKQLFAITLNTGEIEFVRPTPFRTTAILDNSQLIIGDERGYITLLSHGNERQWKFRSGGEISRMFAVGTDILATSHDNFVYLLGGKSGSVVWKKRLTGRIARIGELKGIYALISGIDEKGAFLTDLASGKVAGQLAFDAAESLVHDPIMMNERIYLLTGIALYAYSLDGCTRKSKEAAP